MSLSRAHEKLAIKIKRWLTWFWKMDYVDYYY
jgi:hypothetical protein